MQDWLDLLFFAEPRYLYKGKLAKGFYTLVKINLLAFVLAFAILGKPFPRTSEEQELQVYGTTAIHPAWRPSSAPMRPRLGRANKGNNLPPLNPTRLQC